MKSHGCTLDCFGCCKLNVHVENNKVVKIEADKNHPYTKGIMCQKGRNHLKRLNDKDRLYSPMKKEDGKWVNISFEEAIDIIASKLKYYKEKYSSNAVLHYSESGSGSILKAIEDIFFNFYGGISKTDGGTCWSAGTKAQKYDFGYNKSHAIDDVLNSKNIILWSKNPANSHIQLFHRIKKAREKGIKVIVIDPLSTDSVNIADIHIKINPSTDAALAMAMTKIVIEENLQDTAFIKENVIGFEEYKAYLDTLDINYLCKECGVDISTVKELTYLYAKEKYSSIHLGYGLQRYKNGGNAVRAIDALAAITGSIGKKGGGVNYSNKVYPDVLNLDPYNSRKHALNEREFDLNHFPDFTKENLKAIFISKANPLNQWPNLNEFTKAFKSVEFKVCIDMFLTDTAKHCDLVIPCTNTLESEDLVYTSMSNPYIVYNEKCVEPKHKLMDEYYFFRELARKMEIKEYPYVSKKEYLAQIIKPLEDRGITLEKIKNEYVTIQEDDVAWKDLIFKTTSKKIEIYSESAKENNLSPIPVYTNEKNPKLRLITTHPKASLMSQGFKDIDTMAIANISENTAKNHDLLNGEVITLKSANGAIDVQVSINKKLMDSIVHMETGWWEKSSNPNFLTEGDASDIGKQIAYYDTFVEIKKKI
ncbi:molybdopterin-dependent oxidoreductase [Clostridium sp. CX1]|uniref:molybdopterin-dependent oxidoreductase n=1 Tax=Clostridium sp. CX1 TaxID=2978346 RepID=UPI0021C16C42|nr:molybdopterin-dependent oxidoreductase [Clostridium sp. CX1]MCT8977729.1 molybdopterin-dependent oxidoreductase [Clostridium sp. CX1]